MKIDLKPIKADPSVFGDDFFVDIYFIKANKIELSKRGKLAPMGAFFIKYPQLANGNLMKTSILGYPADAIFCSREICSNTGMSAALMFVLVSGMQDAQIALDIDKNIAVSKRLDYLKDYTTATHYWAEFSLNGKRYAADFAQQLVYEAEDYYAANQHNPSHIVRANAEDIELCDVVDAYVKLAHNLCRFSGYQQNLLDSYKGLINCMDNSPASKYFVTRMQKSLEYIEISNVSDNYYSDAFLLAGAKHKDFKTENLKNLFDGKNTPSDIIGKIRKALEQLGQSDAVENAISRAELNKIFYKTEKFEERIAGLAITGQWESN